MKVLETSLLAIALMAKCTNILACESYEECMDEAKKFAYNSCLNGCDSISDTGCKDICKDADFSDNFFETSSTAHRGFNVLYLKSIAYKLDEISKKLDD